jgi:hypothetical protein
VCTTLGTTTSMKHSVALKTCLVWLGLCTERAILIGFHPLNCASHFPEESGIYIQYSQRGFRIFRVPTAVKIDRGIDYVFQVNRVLIGGKITRHLSSRGDTC